MAEPHEPSAEAPEPATPGQRRRRRKLIAAAGVVFLLLVLALGPPLLNANRLSRRIATSMSESLGRPVHLDNVSLHLLPVPGFTLENLVVSEDPAFGYEPVIRSNRVEATIRVSSLWRRQVEVSSIRFVVDPNGSAPSLNLVRRADGRWNLESILLHAAREEAAPTAQTTPGPAPRFPYIEATGARINVKMGYEKEPFALTETDFALWLPSPQQWRLRLEGKPTRTDTSVFDTGLLTIEGTLKRADRLTDVPVDLTAEWKRAPLGQASVLVSGYDMGWRGDIGATATMHGTLGNAAITTAVKLKHVRRSDFIPADMLTFNVECNGHLDVADGLIHNPACTLPLGDTDQPQNGHAAGVIAATADTLDLTSRHAAGATVGMTGVPEAWLLNWARLFSQRLPANASWGGTVSGSIGNAAAPAESVPPFWSGVFTTSVSAAAPNGIPDRSKIKTGEPGPPSLALAFGQGSLTLQPVNLATGDDPPLILSGTATPELYRLQLSGTATPAELSRLTALLPPLGDGVPQALEAPPAALTPASAPATGTSAPATAPMRIDLLCTRAWGGPQTCVDLHPTRAPESPRRSRGR